jgi:putative glutamine amidotransferase
VTESTRRMRIGITGPRHGARLPRFCVALVTWFYSATPVQLRPGDDIQNQQLDAVVVTGGHDVDPVLYAAEPEVKPKYDTERDQFESAVIDAALRQNLPLLGICRGAQLLNVRLGGNLFQELRSRRQITSNRWTALPLKTLCVRQHSKLEQFLGCRQCRINSLHNQAIDRVGDHLAVSGRDLDGIVQAIEDPQAHFIVGVQWHPEFLIYNRRQRGLFKALIEAARQRSAI